MKKLLVVASIAAACSVSGSVYAVANGGAIVYLTATVPPTCVISTATFSNSTVDLSEQIDANSATLTTAPVSVGSVNAMCNGNNTQLSMRSVNTGLSMTDAITVTGTFAPQILPYTVSANWAGFGMTYLSGADDFQNLLPSFPGPISGVLSATVQLEPQQYPLIAGTYNDTLIVTVSTGP